MATVSAGVEKVLAKLRRNIATGQYYEAQQMFKTVYHRHRARQQLAESYELAEEGAKLQLTEGQLNCGVELGLLLVEAYDTDSAEPTPELVQRVVNLIEAFPREGATPEDAPPVEDCIKFASAAVRWIKRVSGDDEAAAEPHIKLVEGRLAAYIWDCLGWQGLGLALPHFALAGDAKALAAALRESVAHGLPAEEDLFLARAAFQTAAAPGPAPAQLAMAQEVVRVYAEEREGGLPDTPLLHCVALMLEALERRSAALAQLVVERYAASLERDPTLWPLVLRCKEVQLGERPPAMGGMLGELLKGLGGPA